MILFQLLLIQQKIFKLIVAVAKLEYLNALFEVRGGSNLTKKKKKKNKCCFFLVGRHHRFHQF